MSDGSKRRETPLPFKVVDEAYVIAAAKVLDLPLAPEHLPGVVENLQRIEAIAEPLNATPLGPEDEAAPVWMP